MNSAAITPNPWNLRHEDGLVLAGIQVTLPPLAVIVSTRRRPALRAHNLHSRQQLGKNQQLALVTPQLHVRHSPGGPNSQNLCV